jgi:hypothetical protein
MKGLTMLTDEQIDRVSQAVQAGEITEEQGRQLVREAVAHGTLTALIAPEAKPDPRKAPPIKKTDRQLLVDALVSSGATRTEALEASLVTDPASKAEIVKAERERQQAKADAATAAKYDQTPEGRIERGQQLAAARAEKERLAPAATELLREQGLRDADLQALSLDECLVLAGLQEAPEPARRESGSRMLAEGLDTTASMAAAEIASDRQGRGGDGQ